MNDDDKLFLHNVAGQVVALQNVVVELLRRSPQGQDAFDAANRSLRAGHDLALAKPIPDGALSSVLVTLDVIERGLKAR